MLMSNFKALGTVSHRVFECSTKRFCSFLYVLLSGKIYGEI